MGNEKTWFQLDSTNAQMKNYVDVMGIKRVPLHQQRKY